MRAVALLLGALSLAGTCGAAEARPADGLRLVGQRQLDPRLSELSFRTPAVEGATGVRVLLPGRPSEAR